MIDYWCNAFTPDRASRWAAVIEEGGLTIRTRAGDEADDFAAPGDMVARMDRLGVSTLVLPVCELAPEAPLDDFGHYAVRPAEIEALAEQSAARLERLGYDNVTAVAMSFATSSDPSTPAASSPRAASCSARMMAAVAVFLSVTSRNRATTLG